MAGIKKSGIAALAMAAVLGMTGTALAANPQIKSATASVANNGALSVTVQVVGLGNLPTTVDVSLNADADVTWGCVNKSLKAPKAENKRTSSTQTGKSGTFPVDKNGSAKGTLTTDPPSAPSATDLKCPNSMTVELVAVTYKNIAVNVPSLSLSQTISPISRTFYP